MSMTVGRAIALLSQFSEDHILILSSDAEGNNFHHVTEFDVTRVEDPESYYVDISEDDEPNAVIAWP